MRIIKNGSERAIPPQVVTCRECKSVLEVARSDVQPVQGRYNETLFRGQCPVCKSDIWANFTE